LTKGKIHRRDAENAKEKGKKLGVKRKKTKDMKIYELRFQIYDLKAQDKKTQRTPRKRNLKK